MTYELKKQEAIRRMKMIGIFDGSVKDFERENLLSQSLSPIGACYWVNGEQLERVRKFEEKHNALVYFVIHSYTEFGQMDSYLFVSDYEDEWEQEREDLKHNQALAYVYNYNTTNCSEFGFIGFEMTAAAGLKRIW